MTSIRGGESFNIFPEKAYIRGSMRFFDREEGKKAKDIVIKVAEHTAAMHNCEVDCSKMAGEVGIPVINDVLYAKQAKKQLSRFMGKRRYRMYFNDGMLRKVLEDTCRNIQGCWRFLELKI